MKLKEIYSAYAALKGATIATLSEEAQGKVFRINRAIFPIVQKYEAERSDVCERLKPSDYDELIEIQSKAKANSATKEEAMRFFVSNDAYERSVEKHLRPLLEEEHELNIEALPEADLQKIMKENKWTFEKYNALDVFTKKEE